MRATQALLPVSSGIENGKKGNIFCEPDKNKGYEMGTWDCSHRNYFQKILKVKSLEEKNDVNENVYIYHSFTEEERIKILFSLKNDWEEKKYIIRKKEKIGITLKEEKKKEIVENIFHDLCLKEKWHHRLVELFSKPDDLPVYYFY